MYDALENVVACQEASLAELLKLEEVALIATIVRLIIALRFDCLPAPKGLPHLLPQLLLNAFLSCSLLAAEDIFDIVLTDLLVEVCSDTLRYGTVVQVGWYLLFRGGRMLAVASLMIETACGENVLVVAF